jgi:tetratricopeptide (TPR) repeat protein
MTTKNQVTQRLPWLIGRQKEKESIARAIEGQGPPILFLEGIAGIGKTVLLEETSRIAQEHGVLCPPIVDFYDTEMHAHRALESAIALNLDPGKEIFREYWARQEEIERTLLPERKTLREQQEELWGLFLKAYTTVADRQRVVLRFDTAERLEYGRDSPEVLNDCEVSPEDAPSWEWHLKRIGDLKNTAILIAARPTSTGLLKQRLLDAHRERVLPLGIEGFTLEDTEAYFRTCSVGKQIANEAPEMIKKVHTLANGRPILIALALDWLERGIWDRHTLEEIQRSGFEMALVEQVRELKTPLDKAVKYAALCRKGCNAVLLTRLGISKDEAHENIQRLLTLSFVKSPRPGSRDLFFLHDEMYDLVEKHVWLVDSPDYGEQAQLDQVIIDWYTEQIDALEERIKVAKDWRERTAIRRQRQLLIAERLYYQFDLDPRIGYREYNRLDEEAVGSREHEWDTWLRNEALWFTSHRAWRQGRQNGGDVKGYPRRDPAWLQEGRVVRSPAVDYDCRRRWINRYIAQNDMQKAARIAEKLLQKQWVEEEPELWRGGIQVALATAQAYMGGEFLEDAFRNFQKSIERLNNVPQDHKESWLHPFLLGTAFLYQGLAFCNALRLREAAQANDRAIGLFRSIGYRPRLAEALNNQSYVFVRQGRLRRAIATCKEALDIRQELGYEYEIGLSLNTKGIIEERRNNPIVAIENSKRALELFRAVGSQRGTILADINLGRSYRRKARSSRWGQKDEDFAAGIDHLGEAIHLQETLGASADMFYRIEAHNEMGCVYRDWAATLLEKGFADGKVQGYLEQAECYLEKAIQLTVGIREEITMGQEVQHIDSLEDLARVYFLRAKVTKSPYQVILSKMESLLDKAEDEAKEYHSRRMEKWDELELILGKLCFQRARLASLRGDKDATARYYALATGYAEGYSPDIPELHKFVNDTVNWLSDCSQTDAERYVCQMHGVLMEQGLRSNRLRKHINKEVYRKVGVYWPGDDLGVKHG